MENKWTNAQLPSPLGVKITSVWDLLCDVWPLWWSACSLHWACVIALMGEEVCIFKNHWNIICSVVWCSRKTTNILQKNFYRGFRLSILPEACQEVEGQGSGKLLEVEGQRIAELRSNQEVSRQTSILRKRTVKGPEEMKAWLCKTQGEAKFSASRGSVAWAPPLLWGLAAGTASCWGSQAPAWSILPKIPNLRWIKLSGELQDKLTSVLFCSVQFSRSVVSNSLQPHGLQHARLPCPSPTPRASCP